MEEVRRAEWPALPPLQRTVTGPALVTDPDRFQRELAAWGNPSFLGTPGHLLSPDAPSGEVSGVAVRDSRRSFDTATGPPAPDSWTAAPVLSSASSVPTAQRSAADVGASPPPLRTVPHAEPAPRVSIDLVSAASAALLPPVERPSVPLPPQPPAVDHEPGASTVAVRPVGTPAVDVQRSRDVGTGAPAAGFPRRVVQRSVPGPTPQDQQDLPVGAEQGGAGESAVPEPVELASTEEVGPAVAAPDAARKGVADETPISAGTLGSAPDAGIVDAGPPISGAAGGAADPVPAPVQRLSQYAGVPATSGRRRLGLGAPLPRVPSFVADPVPSPSHEPALPVQTPRPLLDPTPPVVQRLGAPAPHPSAVPPGAGRNPGVQRLAVDTPGSRGSSAPSAGAPAPDAPAPSAPTRRPPAWNAAVPPGTRPAETAPEVSATDATDATAALASAPVAPVTDAPVTEDPATEDPATETPAAVAPPTEHTIPESPGTQNTAGEATADAPAPAPGAADLPLPEGPGPEAPAAGVPTLGVPRLSVPLETPTADVQRSTGPAAGSWTPGPAVAGGKVPTTGADVPPALQREGVPAVEGRSTGQGAGLSAPWVAADPQLGTSTASGSPAPLLGAEAPLLVTPGAGTGSVQRQPDIGAAARAGGRPLRLIPRTGETAVVGGLSNPAPAVGRPEQAPVRQPSAATEGLEPAGSVEARPEPPMVASTGEPGGGDTDWDIPASGSFVGPVGARPLQRRLAEAVAPVSQPTASVWPLPDLAAGGPMQRYATAPAVPPPAGPRYADGRPTVSRTATAPGVPPSVYGPPPSPARPPSGRAEVWPGRAEPALSPTLQTLLPADDADPRPAVPSPSDLVVERAESSADGPDRGTFDAFAPLTVSAVVEPPTAAGAAAAGEAGAAGAPGAAASVPPGDVDALVRRLYDPLARRLRAELRLDRERIGRSLDLRH